MNENETVMIDEKEVYEISFIFSDRLDESKAIEKAEALKKDIASLEGSFISEETPYMRELSYEMTRVVSNANVKFSRGYFGWIKFELAPSSVEEINKKLKLDEEIVRFLILKTTKENDVFTKEIPVMKNDPVMNNISREEIVEEDDSNIDTTKEDVLEEEIDEDTKKELDKEVENIEE